MSRATIDVKPHVAGLESAEFSTRVESDRPLVVRSHDDVGRRERLRGACGDVGRRSALTWYLAEGATVSRASISSTCSRTRDSIDAQVRVRYLRPTWRALEKTYDAASDSPRTNIWVNDEEIAGLARHWPRRRLGGDRRRPTACRSSSSAPCISNARRRDVRRRPRERRRHGAGDRAGSSPRARPAPFFDLLRPHREPRAPTAAQIEATLPAARRHGPREALHGRRPTAASTSGWTSRIRVARRHRRLHHRSRSINGVPIIVERAMWWPGDAATLVRGTQLTRSDDDRARSGRWPRAKSAARETSRPTS